MLESYAILNDRAGDAQIMRVSGGVYSYLTHKQAKELAALGNHELEDLQAKDRAWKEQVDYYVEQLKDPDSPSSKRALTEAVYTVEVEHYKTELQLARAMNEGAYAENERLRKEVKMLQDDLNSVLRGEIELAEAEAEVEPGASVSEGL